MTIERIRRLRILERIDAIEVSLGCVMLGICIFSLIMFVNGHASLGAGDVLLALAGSLVAPYIILRGIFSNRRKNAK